MRQEEERKKEEREKRRWAQEPKQLELILREARDPRVGCALGWAALWSSPADCRQQHMLKV